MFFTVSALIFALYQITMLIKVFTCHPPYKLPHCCVPFHLLHEKTQHREFVTSQRHSSASENTAKFTEIYVLPIILWPQSILELIKQLLDRDGGISCSLFPQLMLNHTKVLSGERDTKH